MTISGNVPKHLVVGARTGFLSAVENNQYLDYQKVAEIIPVTAKATELVDLGAAPMPVENKGTVQARSFIEKTLEVKPTDWELTVHISRNALQDDQTSSLDRKVRSAGEQFLKHIDKRVFTVLNGGDGTTYGLCYDGQEFFDSDHVDKGGEYQTNQDNEYALALSLDNFKTVRVAARKFKDDQGEYVNNNHTQLVVPPDLEDLAIQICNNPQAYDTANREINPYNGRMMDPIIRPELDSTAWHLLATSGSVKPLLVVMREEPNLQASWFDPTQREGGFYYFKYFARYEVYYGDWRLAIQGNT